MNLGRCKPFKKTHSLCNDQVCFNSVELPSHHLDQRPRTGTRFVNNQYIDTSPGCFTGLLDQLKWDTLQQTYKLATCPLLQDPEQTSGDTTSYLPPKEQGIAIELDRLEPLRKFTTPFSHAL